MVLYLSIAVMTGIGTYQHQQELVKLVPLPEPLGEGVLGPSTQLFRG